MADIDLAGLLKQFTSEYDTTKTEREKRYGAGVSELTDIVNMFKPGGEFATKMTGSAMGAAETGFAGAGLGGVMPQKASNPLIAAINRMRSLGESSALTQRAGYKAAFPKIYADPSAITNLATGGFSGLTQQLLAESLGGPLSDPYELLQTPTSSLVSGRYPGTIARKVPSRS